MITKESLKQQYPNHSDADIEELYWSGDIQDTIKIERAEEMYILAMEEEAKMEAEMEAYNAYLDSISDVQLPPDELFCLEV